MSLTQPSAEKMHSLMLLLNFYRTNLRKNRWLYLKRQPILIRVLSIRSNGSKRNQGQYSERDIVVENIVPSLSCEPITSIRSARHSSGQFALNREYTRST